MIGRNLTEYLSQRRDWNVIGLSRRLPDFKSRARHVSVDLLKDADTAAQAKEWKHVTHVFYAAYQSSCSFAEEVQPNLEMLRNLLRTLEPVALKLERVVLNEGVNTYGVHLGPFKTPAKETDARTFRPTFIMHRRTS